VTTAADRPVRGAGRGAVGAPGPAARPGPQPRTTPITLPPGSTLHAAGPVRGWGALVPDPGPARRTPGWGWATDRPGRRWAVAGAVTPRRPARRATPVRAKLREWAARYLLAEVAGTLAALVAALTVHAGTGSLASAALAGSVAESTAFYGVVLRRLVPGLWAAEAGHRPVRRVLRTARGVLTEASDFAVAELADTLLLRPGLIFLATGWVGAGVGAGLVLGKLLADIGFYAVVIPSYELRKRLMSR
jgi:hypothetical protein